jgi:hypothetical protein
MIDKVVCKNIRDSHTYEYWIYFENRIQQLSNNSNNLRY